MLSLVKATVTQPEEKLLSSEMNLLNNLCLMGLSIIFCFCACLAFLFFFPFLHGLGIVCHYSECLFPSLYSLSASLSYSLWPSFSKFTWKRKENNSVYFNLTAETIWSFGVFVTARAFVHFLICPDQSYQYGWHSVSFYTLNGVTLVCVGKQRKTLWL